jgi:phytoene desaturase
MSSPKLHVTVIGAGLGGMSAAIHLRLAGHEVKIFESGATTGGRANRLELGGLRFDTGPTLLNYPWVFGDLFRAAGRPLDEIVRLRRVDPSITYRWPDGRRLTLSSELERLRGELERMEPGSARALDRFLPDASEKFRIAFDKLVPQNQDNPLLYFASLSVREFLKTALWRSMYAELRRFFHSRYICEAFGSYAMYLGGSPFGLPGLFSILPYGELTHGLWLPQGGIYALIEAVENLARELGVEIHTHSRVNGIVTKGGRVRAVRLEDGSECDSACVVSNVDLPATLTELLGQPSPRLKMSPSVLTYYWVVKGQPAGLDHHTIFLPRDYQAAFEALSRGRELPSDPAFYVAAPAATDSCFAGSEACALFVLVPVPLLSRLKQVDWNSEVPRLKQTILRRLEESGVDLPPSCIRAERVLTPEDWRRRFGLFGGSAFGAAHTLRQMGPFRPRNYSRRIRGLYFTGASTTPGTGLPMVVLSGKLTAERIAQHVR